MSKESYARGFCKAAAAAGVDPVALAKYAQQYKTDGWAPKIITEPMVSGEKISKIPHPTVGGQMHTIGTLPSPASIFYGATKDSPDSEERLVRSLDPRRAAFNEATTNAAQKVWEAIARAGYGRDDFSERFSPNTIRLLEKLWDDEMKRTTSAPPVRVSAPVKEK